MVHVEGVGGSKRARERGRERTNDFLVPLRHLLVDSLIILEAITEPGNFMVLELRQVCYQSVGDHPCKENFLAELIGRINV